jgi:hypothetical protein
MPSRMRGRVLVWFGFIAVTFGICAVASVVLATHSQASGDWGQEGEDLLGTPGWNTQFGSSVDVSSDGSVLAIGAPNNRGYVETYTWDGSQWAQRGSRLELASYSTYEFGTAVALSPGGFHLAV